MTVWRNIPAGLAALAASLVLLPGPAPAQSTSSGERGAEAAPDDAAIAIIDRFSRIDTLPRYKRIAEIGNFSSYDRTGGNDDGFNGTHSFIRREGDALVIAEMRGPGAITRIWTPTPSDDVVEFYIDGEAHPRIREKFSDLFSGRKAPFLAPLSIIGAGGFTSYVPIAFAKSIKVVMRAPRVNFYQVNYERYADARGVRSYRPGDRVFRAALDRAAALLKQSGGTLDVATLAAGAPVRTQRTRGNLPAGGRATLFESDRPGRVVALRLGPAAALAGTARDLLVNIYYEGEVQPSVSVPAGDLFGYAWGEPAMRSLLVGTAGETNYLFLPMPYDRSIRIELQSDRRDGAIAWEAEVAHTDRSRRPDEGRLYAVWRRENPTTRGRPFTFINSPGRGHLVGAILQAQGDKPGVVPEYFEGDDVTTIDGRVAIRGTGSEDFFNGGWYDVPGRWDDRVSLPLSGSLGYARPLGRTGGYRFLLGDPYPYMRSIDQTIEHGPSGNALDADYSAVTFVYADRAPVGAGTAAAVAHRAIATPRELVFTPGWTTPVAAFSWNQATLAKADEKIGGEDLRHLQFRASGREVFGPHYIAFDCEMPEAGRYDVFVQAIAGPTQGRVQLFENEVPVGDAADLYAATRSKTPDLPMGRLSLERGHNRVLFKLVGKDARSSGLGFDVYRIVLRKVD